MDAFSIEQPRPILNFFCAEVDAAQADFRAAADFYRIFMESRPPNADGLTRFATLLLEAGDTAEARTHFEEALALVPAMAEARLGLAKLALAEGATEEAQAHLDAPLAIWADAPPSFSFAAETRALRAKLASA